MKFIPIHLANAQPIASEGIIIPNPGMPLHDRRGRAVHDLRISVTDRCNFRCVYCMPRSVFGADYPFLPRKELLSFEEITRVARAFAARGVQKIRITGGEPLLRKHVENLVAMLTEIEGLELTLTTNGVLLPRMARTLRDAGLHRVTVSLDAIDDATFRAMNDADYPVAAVLQGIEAAERAGLAPIKVNMVVKRGVNDHGIVDMARHFRGSGHILRFIEFMDVGSSNGWEMSAVLPSREVIARINEVFPVEPIEPNYTGEVAERWRYVDGQGEIGVISSVTQAFCSTCTRIRLSTEGKLYTCLFAQQGHDLRELLRAGASDEELDRAIANVWSAREDHYSEIRTANTAGLRKIEMSYIGG
ncbi:GTP 3',8-cyclase MoaA [Azoarcus sp. KH32C]|uniref:GTP 3',8-cyclase MoaA n=1 Tax=Azoarcus sp. KH32C TaxID=748247 RepID=UPI00023863F6|nr:GTP 3',8-cyclase MoaA [Azoarcus sp. KH32C]BAL25174.1 molybdenum cofactor biosynthesis protein A [Azoarcus sp. KH32C]